MSQNRNCNLNSLLIFTIVVVFNLNGCGTQSSNRGSTITGHITRASYVVPAGQTLTVTGTTIIDCTDTLQIDGHLIFG